MNGRREIECESTIYPGQLRLLLFGLETGGRGESSDWRKCPRDRTSWWSSMGRRSPPGVNALQFRLDQMVRRVIARSCPLLTNSSPWRRPKEGCCWLMSHRSIHRIIGIPRRTSNQHMQSGSSCLSACLRPFSPLLLLLFLFFCPLSGTLA